MDERKLKKPAEEVRQVLEHYLTTGRRFTDTPDADPGLADYEGKLRSGQLMRPPAFTDVLIRPQ